jgi:hypothetical protein
LPFPRAAKAAEDEGSAATEGSRRLQPTAELEVSLVRGEPQAAGLPSPCIALARFWWACNGTEVFDLRAAVITLTL